MNNFIKRSSVIITILPIFILAELGQLAAAPHRLGDTITLKEHLGRDWPRTLVTYQREFPAGTARPREVRLVDATGQVQACQLWRVKEHPDGSIASARISFLTGLAKGSRYRFELQAGKPGGDVRPLRATTDAAFTTLDNGIVALRLPRAGEMKFDPPLAMGQDQAAMVAAYGQQAAKGIAQGPIHGVRLVDGRWVGGSYFFAAKPDEAPRVTGYTCRITEQGPLFVEAVVRYTFTGGGWYEFTARLLAEDPAVRIDEQFDMGTPGSMWDYAKGAPLVTLSLGAYAVRNNGSIGQLYQSFGLHSRVRFGSMTNTGGWPGGGAVGGAPAHAFSDSADYVRAFGDYGPQRWMRQVAFLKGKAATAPSYFVFRDSFTARDGEARGLEAKWWYLRTLGRKNQVRPGDDGFHYASEFGPKLDVHFLQPAKVAIESRDATEGAPLYAGNAQNWRRAHPDAKPEGDLNVTETITVNAAGPVPAGQDMISGFFVPRAMIAASSLLETIAIANFRLAS